MKIRNIIIGFSALAAVVGTVSCTKGFMEINRDPYGVIDKEMDRDGYNVRAALVGMMSGVISTDVNTAQFTDVLLGCALSGYLAPAKNGWNNITISNYNATEDWYRVFMASDKIIPVIYTNYKYLQIATDDRNILAVGDIVKVAAMHRVTDTYGPIPYSSIGSNGEISVPYDSQKEVYTKMLEELSAAVETLKDGLSIGSFSASADVIYGGNITKWIRFANSLKLRLAMRICYADPDLSKRMADEAINDEVGLITSNEDNAKFSYWGVNGNTLRMSIRYNIATHEDNSVCSTESGDSHAAAEIICYMNGYNDPRRPFYFTKTEFDNGRFGDYVGLRHGIEVPSHVKLGHQYSGVYFESETAPAYWMNAAEVQFLLAEAAAFREKGDIAYNVPGTAQSYYEQGVRLSFEQYEVQGADAYLASDAKPDTYIDPLGTYNYSGVLSTITPKWNPSAGFEEMQERIITQKWIANWLLGCEAWADWRRTGYPRLMPAEYYTSSKGITSSNVKAGARRMPYPDNESRSNAANYAAGVAMLAEESSLGSEDNMATRLWFDCKVNNPCYQ